MGLVGQWTVDQHWSPLEDPEANVDACLPFQNPGGLHTNNERTVRYLG